jgi:hypothetical protein
MIAVPQLYSTDNAERLPALLNRDRNSEMVHGASY